MIDSGGEPMFLILLDATTGEVVFAEVGLNE